ncbi:MAG: hypothetical protein WC511_05065 [Candidatus Pacearchaeota archaeon]
MIKIIEYFKRLKENFLRRKEVIKESRERFYSQCKEGIFNFFKPYLTSRGFYLELENKEGLMDYLSEKKSGKTIESKIESKSRYLDETTQKKINEYTKPVYNAFGRMLNYFSELKKEMGKYDSLSFVYRPSINGYDVETYGNKFNLRFG